MKRLNHKNIVKVFKIYIDNLRGYVYMVMELIRGKFKDCIIKKLSHYSEIEAKILFK